MNIPGTQILRQASSVVHNASRKQIKSANKILLTGVPRLALVDDVRRALKRENIKGITDVALDYHMFTPTGRVFLTLSQPNFMRDNLRALENLTISGIKITAEPAEETNPTQPRPRFRGSKGRADALERGLISPNGTLADITGQEYVTVWGLPGKSGVNDVLPLLTGYEVSLKNNGKPSVSKVPLPEGMFSMFSRFLVKMESLAEAHRLVRDIHNTPWEASTYERPFTVYARKIY